MGSRSQQDELAMPGQARYNRFMGQSSAVIARAVVACVWAGLILPAGATAAPPDEAAETVRRFLAAVSAGDLDLAMREVDDNPAEQRLFRTAAELDHLGSAFGRRVEQFDGAKSTVRLSFGAFDRAQITASRTDPNRFIAWADSGMPLADVVRNAEGRWVLRSEVWRELECYPGRLAAVLDAMVLRFRLLNGLVDRGVIHDVHSAQEWLALTAPLSADGGRTGESSTRHRLALAMDPVRFGLPGLLEGRLRGSDRAVALVRQLMSDLATVRDRAGDADLNDPAEIDRLRRLLLHHPRPGLSFEGRVGIIDEGELRVVTVHRYRALEFDRRTGLVQKLDADAALIACFGTVAEAEKPIEQLRRAIVEDGID